MLLLASHAAGSAGATSAARDRLCYNAGVSAPDPILATVPRPLAEWSSGEDGRVVLVRPRPTTAGLKGTVDLITWWLSPRKVRLDALGSAAWRLIDGRTTVAEIADALAARHEAEDAPGRAAFFVRLLVREGYLELWAVEPPLAEER